jgi:tRNA pseudouridine55 synthase
MYSAKKIRGVRLYELARQNINVRRQPIPVQLYRVNILQYEAPYLHFEVHCSKGTYIRSLADDIGRRLGTVAHLAELRRLSCGAFSLEEAVTLPTWAGDLPAQLSRGYQNYVRLLRAEGLVRRTEGPARPLRPGPSLPSCETITVCRELPTTFKNGNSLLT